MAEFEGKYVNEKNHKKMKNILIGIGVSLICLAAILIAVGVLLIIKGKGLMDTDMNDPDWFDKSSSGGSWLFGGSFMLAISLMFIAGAIALIVKAHTRELASFAVSSVAPVASDTIKYANKEIGPEVGKTIETLTGSVVKTVAKAKNPGKECPKCGKENKKSSKFCAYCGSEMESKLHCTECGAELETDASFCPSCGKKVEQ